MSVGVTFPDIPLPMDRVLQGHAGTQAGHVFFIVEGATMEKAIHGQHIDCHKSLCRYMKLSNGVALEPLRSPVPGWGFRGTLRKQRKCKDEQGFTGTPWDLFSLCNTHQKSLNLLQANT